MKKLFFFIPVIFLIIATTVTKNSTKQLDKKIFEIKENLRVLQDKFELHVFQNLPVWVLRHDLREAHLEKRLQSEDRAHRIGQKKSVTYIDIMADETVDSKIVKSLRKKINIASEVLGEELKSWI